MPEKINSKKMGLLDAYERTLIFLDNTGLNSSLKEKYTSYAKDVWSYLSEDTSFSLPISKKRIPLPLLEAAKFFDYLECRALKSTTVRAFSDILLCRAMFYAPVPAKKLFRLPPPSKQNQFLSAYNQTFPVPASFMQLRKSFDLKDQLLVREFTEDQLSKKIHRLGSYAELESPLNPTILRISQDSICRDVLSLNRKVMQLLPSR